MSEPRLHRIRAEQPAEGGAAERWRTKSVFLLVALAVLALDQWSKWLVEAHLPHLASVEIVPTFDPVMLELGLPKFARLKRLNTSHRRLAATRPVMATRFCRLMSKVT